MTIKVPREKSPAWISKWSKLWQWVGRGFNGVSNQQLLQLMYFVGQRVFVTKKTLPVANSPAAAWRLAGTGNQNDITASCSVLGRNMNLEVLVMYGWIMINAFHFITPTISRGSDGSWKSSSRKVRCQSNWAEMVAEPLIAQLICFLNPFYESKDYHYIFWWLYCSMMQHVRITYNDHLKEHNDNQYFEFHLWSVVKLNCYQ